MKNIEKLTVTMETVNAAFSALETANVAPTESDHEAQWCQEVARILRELADRAELSGEHGINYLKDAKLRDVNGNVVGQVKISRRRQSQATKKKGQSKRVPGSSLDKYAAEADKKLRESGVLDSIAELLGPRGRP